MDKEILLNVECDNCKEAFKLYPSFVNHKKEYSINNKHVYLTYFDCPKCHKRHFVQIDTKESLEVLKDARRQFAKLMSLKRKEKQIPKSQSDKFEKTRKHLSDIRNNLCEEYAGKHIHDEDANKNFKLAFTKF